MNDKAYRLLAMIGITVRGMASMNKLHKKLAKKFSKAMEIFTDGAGR